MPKADYRDAPTYQQPWLREYAAWHSEHRHAADARFLMFSCQARMSGISMGRRGRQSQVDTPACGGHGNWGATEMEVWYPVP